MKSVTLKHKRRSISVDCSKPVLTTQAHKNMCDINLIMAQYIKTGVLPQVTTKTPRFIDNTLVPTLEDAFNVVNGALEQFSALPPQVRKLMDNDPSKLESFISDPENSDILLKYGVLVSRPTPPPPVEPNKELKPEGVSSET